jgi:hypothetical protein
MSSWSIVPETYESSKRMPRVTYVVPMTPAAAVAQIAVMQNRNRLYSHVDDVLEDVKHKADAAMDAATETRYQLQEAAKNTMYNQLIMLILLVVFLGLFIYLKKYRY